MDKTYLQLNIVNTLTILIMASAGALVLGFIAAGLMTYWPSNDDAVDAAGSR